MGRKIGIDLGTTNSVAAIVDGTRPKILDNCDAKPQTASVVSLKKRKGGKGAYTEEIIVGDSALDNWPMAPKDTITSVKRLMGRGIADPTVKKVQKEFSYEVIQPSDGTKDSIRVLMGKKEYSPIDISGMILRKLKEDAEYRLGEEVTHAVITVPAYFSQIQKDATNRAAIKAGLKVIKILDEPTAAAIAYGLDSEDSKDARTILVYDLGGGTFDVSLLMWSQGVFAPLNLEGDMWLGGDNFDQVLIDHTVDHVKEDYEIDPTSNARFMATLKKTARAAKERLGASRSTDIIVPGLLQDKDGNLIDIELEIMREEFEDMIRPLVNRTVSLVEKAIANANFTKDDIHFVLMAGNSTLVPMVQDAMVNMFGTDKVRRNIHPKHCVALGAAVVAAISVPDEDQVDEEDKVAVGTQKETICYSPDPDDPQKPCGERNRSDATHCERCGAPLIVLGNVAAFSYGIQSAGDNYNIFVKKGDPYPTQDPIVNTFYTQKANQRIISIPVYGGEHLERASANDKQGEAFAILPSGLPKNTPVYIKLSLNHKEIFEVSAQLDDGTDLEPWILQIGGPEERARDALQRMEKLIEVKRKELDPTQRNKIEQEREKAFKKMKQEDFQGAMKVIEDIKITEPPPIDLCKKAEYLVNFLQFIVHEYNWVLDPKKAYQLTNLVSEVKSALEKDDKETLEDKVKGLEKALALPKFVWDIIEIKGGIENRVRPLNPKKANELREDLQAIENQLKAKDYSAIVALENLKEKLKQIIIDLTPPDEDVCPECDTPLEGERYCPNPKCKFDTWGVADQQSGTPSSSEWSV